MAETAPEQTTTAAEKPAASAPPPPPQASPAYLDHLRKVNDVFYDQIKIADQKAAYIFTFMVAFMVTSAEGRGVFTWSRYANGGLVLSLLSGVLALAVCVSAISAIMVVLPRVRTGSTSLFWGGWRANRDAFMAAAEQGDPAYLFREYLGNVDNLALIAGMKYRFVALAFRALTVAVLAYVALLAWN